MYTVIFANGTKCVINQIEMIPFLRRFGLDFIVFPYVAAMDANAQRI